MKKLVEEVSGEGLESFLGERIQVWCLNYIYEGKLIGVNENDIKLEDAGVVYQTGDLTVEGYEDRQKTVDPLYIRTAAIESYGPSK
jgi:hypothetical protein